MIAVDLGRRARRRFSAIALRAKHRLGVRPFDPGPVAVSSAFRHVVDTSRRNEIVAAYEANFSSRADKESRAAALLMQHRFDLLGHGSEHGPSIDWSLDPASGRRWSKEFSADIPFRGEERLGDIKLPWELAKHQYFFTLGKARWLTGDDAFGREILQQIAHWIDDNPCCRGIHWISALESGTRVVSWILAYPFFADLCDADMQQRAAASMGEQLLFVEANLSLDRFPNTHLIGEAAALLLGGLFLDCRHSSRWRRKGLLHLERQIDTQVRPDGAHAEQSPAYHRFCLDHYYLAHAVLAANGLSFSPHTLDRIERMTAFLGDMLLPNGKAAGFGDCDDSRGIWCHAESPDDFRSLLALGAVLFDRPDFKFHAAGPAEELLWLHGPEAVSRFERIAAAPPRHTSAGYPSAGYYCARSGWSPGDALLVFDCGPLGWGPAAHGHADALGFELYAAGYPFIVDSGTYSYNIDYPLRNAFRSTQAHNTVVVDGVDQSVPEGRMSWSHVAAATPRRWIAADRFDIADGEHDGYRRLPDPVTHRRAILFLKPDVWLVYDMLVAAEAHRGEAYFHVRPDCTVELDRGEGRAVLTAPNGARLFAACRPVHTADDASLTLELDVAAARHSERYGLWAPSAALRAAAAFSGTVGFATSFTTSESTSVSAAASSEHLRIEVEGPDRARTELVYALAPARVAIGDVRFRGSSLCLVGARSAPTAIEARDCAELCIPGIIEVASEVPLPAITAENDVFTITHSPDSAAAARITVSRGFRVVERRAAESAAVDPDYA